MRRDRLFLCSALALAMTLASMPAQAQKGEKYGFFDHVAVAASIGTDGIGFDAAAPLTDWGALRVGVSFLPELKYDKDVNIKDNNPTIADKVNIEGKLKTFDLKLLADFYPFKGSSFHITAGAFIGKEKPLTATNTNMFIKDPSKYGKLGLMLGDYRVTTDENGYIKADLKVNTFKPYLGVGFGRAVPKKSRISVSCDFGLQFWGNPGLYAWTTNDWGDQIYHKFKPGDLDENDDKTVKDILDTVDKLNVYPVLNIRLSGRIF